MKTFQQYMDDDQATDTNIIEESKLLTAAVVQMRLRAISSKLKNKSDTNEKLDLLADMLTTFAMLNVFNSLYKKRGK